MFFQDMKKAEIDPALLDHNAAAWINKYRPELAVKTTLRRITSVRSLGVCLGVPVLKDYSAPTAAQANPHPLPGGRADIEKLLKVATEEWQQILITLTGLCGLRISEARAIGPQHFLLERQSLKFLGKGSREREVPLSNRAWSILQFPVLQGKLLSRSHLLYCSDRTARYTITSLGKKAGITRSISSHDLRATFATEAYRKSLDIRAVQMLLGHSSPTQTQLYILSSTEEQRDAASFADDFDEEDYLDD